MTYTRAFLKQRINAGIKGKIGMLTNADDTANQAVRFVIGDIDLLNSKRVSTLTPGLFSDIYSYPAPADLKDQSIVDIRPQVNRSRQSEFTLTTPEEFDRSKENYRVAVSQEDAINRILISLNINDQSMAISTLDSITAGGGTWVVTGDATNLVADSDNYVKGTASLKYDIGSGGTTTAGIKNTSLNTFDITNYLNNSIFHFEYINSPTNLTSYTIRIGSSESDYYEKTVTQTNESTSFSAGWNLLRFDLSSSTVVGSPSPTACDFVSIFMTKTVGKINETGYRADHVWAKKGEIYQIVYYTKYGWRNSSGTYLEDSTSDTDVVIADTNEFELMVQKGIEFAAVEVSEESVETKANQRYEKMKNDYEMKNPSEAKLIQTTYYNF